MNIWHAFSPEKITPESFYAVIEITKGSKIKYELDKSTGLLKLDRILHTSTHYPANYGFIPLTYADDDDPLDVLVICSEEIAPLTLVHVYPIGVIKMEDGDRMDEKIIAVPFTAPYYNNAKTIYDLPAHVFDEMRHFFSVYKTLENKETVVDEIGSRDEAMAIIASCIENYKINHYLLVNNLPVPREQDNGEN